MRLTVELERAHDGRWIAAVAELPGVAVMGEDRLDAFRRVKATALRALADRLERGDAIAGASLELSLSFALI
jgi:predicted RNase H-like HicB family nuclease